MFGIFEKKVNIKYEILATSVIVMMTWIFFFDGGSTSIFLLVAAILGLYMAINIGANDIPNNIGPAVGAGAINIKGAIIIAALFEASGAILAGGGVVNTISKGIINPSQIADPGQFVTIMIATLSGAAIWVNVATFLKAPVSATQSIIGGLVGAGITAIGTNIVNWHLIGIIAAGWLIAPLIGGLISAGLLLSIRHNIIKKTNRGDAAKVWVPIYIGVMVWLFSTYLLIKGLHNIIDNTVFDILLRPNIAIFIGYVLGVITFAFVRIYYKKQSSIFKNSKVFINKLFNVPLLFAVALLSFAHGANDIANAIGPLSAINDSIKNVAYGSKIGVDAWITIVGSIGLVLGISIFGRRLVKTVGTEITKLNQIRAYCAALSAATTAMIAAGLGLPVSLTHITLGGVFGIGLIRQRIKRNKKSDKKYIDLSVLKNIALAWIITIPASGIIAGLTYLLINKFQI